MSNADVFLFNGSLERGRDFKFIKMVDEKIEHRRCLLFLVTPGGDPDAAFKVARYLQSRYEYITVGVSGLCKSAGTLLAIGAHEIAFAPYGELGPLDVQLSKVDQIAQLESGLNISEAFYALEERAKSTYIRLIMEIVSSSGGVVSFQTASHSAVEIISALYGPIFHSIDPEEVGSRSRAMRIGADYGERLNVKSQNLKDGAIDALSDSYSSHGFVIDYLEASALFNKTRLLRSEEMKLVDKFENLMRHPSEKLVMEKIGTIAEPEDEGNGTAVDKTDRRQKERGKGNGRNPKATSRSKGSEASAHSQAGS